MNFTFHHNNLESKEEKKNNLQRFVFLNLFIVNFSRARARRKDTLNEMKTNTHTNEMETPWYDLFICLSERRGGAAAAAQSKLFLYFLI